MELENKKKMKQKILYAAIRVLLNTVEHWIVNIASGLKLGKCSPQNDLHKFRIFRKIPKKSH